MANVPTLHTAADLTQSQAAGGISHLVPSGAILTFAGNAAPTGWLVCDGASLSTSTYANLFAVIGYTFGGSGGSFNLPDLRGRFVRYDDNMGNHGITGVTAANAASRDSGRAHGSAQGQATAKNGLTVTGSFAPASHNHFGSYGRGGDAVGRFLSFGGFATTSTNSHWINTEDEAGKRVLGNWNSGAVTVDASITSDTRQTGASPALGNGDAETRPMNIALNAIIKI